MKKVLIFISIYLTISFLFACFYMSLDRGFYHDIPAADGTLAIAKTDIMQSLCKRITRSGKVIYSENFCQVLYKEPLIFTGEVQNVSRTPISISMGFGEPVVDFEITGIRIDFVGFENDELILKFYNFMKPAKSQMGGGEGSGDLIRIAFRANDPSWEFLITHPSSQMAFVRPQGYKGRSYTEFLSEKINLWGEAIVHSQLEKSIVRVINHKQIFANNNLRSILVDKIPLSENWGTMFYFSSSLAILNPFGEIVPITISARILTIFQSILGIIFVVAAGEALSKSIFKK